MAMPFTNGTVVLATFFRRERGPKFGKAAVVPAEETRLQMRPMIGTHRKHRSPHSTEEISKQRMSKDNVNILTVRARASKNEGEGDEKKKKKTSGSAAATDEREKGEPLENVAPPLTKKNKVALRTSGKVLISVAITPRVLSHARDMVFGLFGPKGIGLCSSFNHGFNLVQDVDMLFGNLHFGGKADRKNKISLLILARTLM
ncbi:hypothetical protein GOBAR_DD18548 [Gossypium barbadense]|nr:hypothetical protein GOBAR_DD18548 [Gossypium barbadense]